MKEELKTIECDLRYDPNRKIDFDFQKGDLVMFVGDNIPPNYPQTPSFLEPAIVSVGPLELLRTEEDKLSLALRSYCSAINPCIELNLIRQGSHNKDAADNESKYSLKFYDKVCSFSSCLPKALPDSFYLALQKHAPEYAKRLGIEKVDALKLPNGRCIQL